MSFLFSGMKRLIRNVMSSQTPIMSYAGRCPICDRDVTFSSTQAWLRDHLLCSRCGSVPRERALALVLQQVRPDWRSARIHESSPIARGISEKLKKQAKRYVATQFFPASPLGQTVSGFRNENLERQTFASGSFDIVVTLDVLEHVNEPEACFREFERTLAPGGIKIFTAPTHKNRTETARRARFLADGSVEHFGPPEYHGNPVDPRGSLVTFDYGYDLPDLIAQWCGLDTHVHRFHDRLHGVLGEFTEVYVCYRR